MKILVINGPNLQLLGKREPEIYGAETLEEICNKMHEAACGFGAELDFLQSSSEAEIVDRIGQTLDDQTDAIIINPAAFTHTSIAILDALRAVKLPAIEVHLTNIFGREDYRQRSVTAAGCIGLIAGLGSDGYLLALAKLAKKS